MKLEVVTLPVSDVDRAKSFYQSLGWRLDIDFDRRRRHPGGPDDAAPLASARSSSARASPGEPGSAERLVLVVGTSTRRGRISISRGVDVSEVFHSEPRGFGLRSGPAGRSYFATPRSATRTATVGVLQEITTAPPRPGVGGLTMDVAALAELLHETPSITARSRRSPHRTTGGTGTRPTWTPARAEAPRTRPTPPPTATWRRSRASSRTARNEHRSTPALPTTAGARRRGPGPGRTSASTVAAPATAG